MTDKKISVAEPVTDLRRIAIVENGEPLIDFRQKYPQLLLDRARFQYRRETLTRESVGAMLAEADRRLPSGYRLGIIECWRAPHIQRRMYQMVWGRFQAEYPDWSDTRLRRNVNRFSAPMNVRVPPPHTTGGAVDLMLLDANGGELDHVSPFDPFDPKSAPLHAPGLSHTARHHRDILIAALDGTGLTNYPSEFWHWSYGDQGWAYRGGHPHALYAAITPDGWTPAPEDDRHVPLEMIEPTEPIEQGEPGKLTEPVKAAASA